MRAFVLLGDREDESEQLKGKEREKVRSPGRKVDGFSICSLLSGISDRNDLTSLPLSVQGSEDRFRGRINEGKERKVLVQVFPLPLLVFFF